jgi:hypothetical protein
MPSQNQVAAGGGHVFYPHGGADSGAGHMRTHRPRGHQQGLFYRDFSQARTLTIPVTDPSGVSLTAHSSAAMTVVRQVLHGTYALASIHRVNSGDRFHVRRSAGVIL